MGGNHQLESTPTSDFVTQCQPCQYQIASNDYICVFEPVPLSLLAARRWQDQMFQENVGGDVDALHGNKKIYHSPTFGTSFFIGFVRPY